MRRALIETPAETIVDAPWGRFATTGQAIVWCASRRLCGALLWGRPDADETRAIMRLFDEFPRIMDVPFDVILDTRGVNDVDAEALSVLTGWMRQHRVELMKRAVITSVIREGPIGFLLAGLLPVIAGNHALRVTTDPADALRMVLGDEGNALSAELEANAARLRGVPRELQVIRERLAASLDATIEDAARDLGMSARSLQRWLAKNGTSFHDEVVTARFSIACELLLTTDLKVSALGARLGISERAVTLLFRAQTGLSPIEWRSKHRPSG